MGYDKNASPTGWYLGSYLLRFVELDDAQRDDPEKRFASWENTAIVRARTFDEAHAKIARIAKEASKVYRGGEKGVRVRWEFVGITDLTAIHEALGDGAEIAWTERPPRKLKTLKGWVRPKAKLRR